LGAKSSLSEAPQSDLDVTTMSAAENEDTEEPDRMTTEESVDTDEDWERFDRLSVADNLSSLIAQMTQTNVTSEPSHIVGEDAATGKASQPNAPKPPPPSYPKVGSIEQPLAGRSSTAPPGGTHAGRPVGSPRPPLYPNAPWTTTTPKANPHTDATRLIGVKSKAKVTVVERDRNVAPRSERVPNTPHGGNAQSASSSGEQARAAQNSIPRSQQIGIVGAYRPRCAQQEAELRTEIWFRETQLAIAYLIAHYDTMQCACQGMESGMTEAEMRDEVADVFLKGDMIEVIRALATWFDEELCKTRPTSIFLSDLLIKSLRTIRAEAFYCIDYDYSASPLDRDRNQFTIWVHNIVGVHQEFLLMYTRKPSRAQTSDDERRVAGVYKIKTDDRDSIHDNGYLVHHDATKAGFPKPLSCGEFFVPGGDGKQLGIYTAQADRRQSYGLFGARNHEQQYQRIGDVQNKVYGPALDFAPFIPDYHDEWNTERGIAMKCKTEIEGQLKMVWIPITQGQFMLASRTWLPENHEPQNSRPFIGLHCSEPKMTKLDVECHWIFQTPVVRHSLFYDHCTRGYVIQYICPATKKWKFADVHYSNDEVLPSKNWPSWKQAHFYPVQIEASPCGPEDLPCAFCSCTNLTTAYRTKVSGPTFSGQNNSQRRVENPGGFFLPGPGDRDPSPHTAMFWNHVLNMIEKCIVARHKILPTPSSIDQMPAHWKYATMCHVGYMIYEVPRNVRNMILEFAIIPERHGNIATDRYQTRYQTGYPLVVGWRDHIQDFICLTNDQRLQSVWLQGQIGLIPWFENNMINALREFQERDAEERMCYHGCKTNQEQEHSTLRYMAAQHCSECYHWNKLNAMICSKCRRSFPNCGPKFEVPTNYVYDFPGLASQRHTPIDERWFPEYKSFKEVTNEHGIKQRCHTANSGEQLNYDQRLNDYLMPGGDVALISLRAFRPKHISIDEWEQLDYEEKYMISNADYTRKIARQRIESDLFGDFDEPPCGGQQGVDRKVRRICTPFVKPGLVLGIAILFALIYKNKATQVAIIDKDMPLRVCKPATVADSKFEDSTTMFACFMLMLYGIFSLGKDIYKFMMKPIFASTFTQTPWTDKNFETKNTQSQCTYNSVSAFPHMLSKHHFKWIEGQYDGVWSGSRCGR